MVGSGPREMLELWNIKLPMVGKRGQEQGLEALRELRQCVATVFASRKHAGLLAAQRDAGLRPLTVYDIQVQGCECKRGYKRPPKGRETLKRSRPDP